MQKIQIKEDFVFLEIIVNMNRYQMFLVNILRASLNVLVTSKERLQPYV
jgi:hypothetical protein